MSYDLFVRAGTSEALTSFDLATTVASQIATKKLLRGSESVHGSGPTNKKIPEDDRSVTLANTMAKVIPTKWCRTQVSPLRVSNRPF